MKKCDRLSELKGLGKRGSSSRVTFHISHGQAFTASKVCNTTMEVLDVASTTWLSNMETLLFLMSKQAAEAFDL
jgi:hypothetical protein